MTPTANELATALKDQSEAYRSEDHRIRLWRAISWIERAEQTENDPDSAFIFHWIAFNALYAMLCAPEESSESERERFAQFLKHIVDNDRNRRLHSMLMLDFQRNVQPLLNNRYVLHRFWQHVQNPDRYPTWEEVLHRSRDRARYALQNRETAVLLQILFDRLYVLRNQMIHGGATYGSQLNREVVEKAADLLGKLVPIITDILVRNPSLDLGPVIFPVIKTPPQ